MRELYEETGLRIGPTLVGPVTWRRSATYRFRGTRRLQHEVVAHVRLEVEAPRIDTAAQLHYEREDYTSWCWMPVVRIVRGAERFYPGRLPELVERFVAGEPIDEPFERFS